jgi:lysophospholipase L1-like esterase
MLPAYLEDGVHPSAKGYEAMAQAAALVLKPLI